MSREGLNRLLADAVGPERRAFRVAGALAAAASTAAVLLLGLSGWFIVGAALAGVGGVLAVQGFNYLLPSAAIRLLAIVRTTARYGERLYGHRAALMALATVRVRLFEKIVSTREAGAVSAGDMVGRLVQDIAALEDSLVRRPALPAAIASGTVGLLLTWLAGPWASISLLLMLIGLAGWAHLATPRLLRVAATDMAAALGRIKSSMVDYAAASPEILAYGMGSSIERGLAAETAELDDARRRFARSEAIVDAALLLGGAVAMGAVLLLSRATLPITVLAMLAAAGAVEGLSAYVRGVARGALVMAAMERLEEIADRASGSGLGEGQGMIARGISIQRDGRYVRAEAGERMAIRGRSGSGKTSLLETLAGVRPAERDCGILLGERPLESLPPQSIRAMFALSPQDAHLLSGTVRDNLRVARSGIDDEAIWAALDVACLATDVRAMPEGLDQWVGDGGARLSGGQRKRLSIARAILAGRPWLVLDEPSEGLDVVTEVWLAKRLDSWLRETGTGLVIVSHRKALLALAGDGPALDL